MPFFYLLICHFLFGLFSHVLLCLGILGSSTLCLLIPSYRRHHECQYNPNTYQSNFEFHFPHECFRSKITNIFRLISGSNIPSSPFNLFILFWIFRLRYSWKLLKETWIISLPIPLIKWNLFEICSRRSSLLCIPSKKAFFLFLAKFGIHLWMGLEALPSVLSWSFIAHIY